MNQQGTRNTQARLRPDEVMTIRYRYQTGDQPSSIAKDYNVSTSHVVNIGKMRKWSHLPSIRTEVRE